MDMNELLPRRKRLFSGANFSAALFYNGDQTRGGSACFRYFSGCAVDGCYLALRRKGGVLLVNEMNLRQAREHSHYPVRLLGKEPAKTLGAALGRGKIGAAAGEMSAAKYFALRKKAHLKLIDAGAKMQQVRGKKGKSELAALAASAKIARRILAGLHPWDCKTEKELASQLKIMALKKGCEAAFEPIVATGKNSALPHHQPGETKLGDFVLVDFGVRHNGYCSDFTRCYFGRKGMKEEKSYLKCKEIFRGILEGLPDCRKGKDVGQLAEKLMKKNGLPRMIHAIGHGIGLEVHEYPHLGAKSGDSLEGVALALEPAAYFSGYGVRFESMVANTKKGWKQL